MSACHICGEDIPFVCRVNSRCGHDVHHACRLGLIPKVKCNVCNLVITNNLVLRIDENENFCHQYCKRSLKRYYPPCPMDGCGIPLCKKYLLSNKQHEEMVAKLEGKDLDERMEVYFEFGLTENDIGGGELTDEEWAKIQNIISSSSEEKQSEEKIVPIGPRNLPAIPPPKTYEPRSLVAGEKYKPPNKSRRSQEHGASLKTLVPRSVKNRVHESHQEDFALFSRGPL